MDDVRLTAEEQQKIIQTENREIRLKSKTKMAWVALFAIIIVTLMCLYVVKPDQLKACETIIMWFYISMTGILAALLGFSSWMETMFVSGGVKGLNSK